jgi:hypothetical protein
MENDENTQETQANQPAKPMYFTLRQLAFALPMSYARMSHYWKHQADRQLLEEDATTSSGDPLFLMTNLPAIRKNFKQYGIKPK